MASATATRYGLSRGILSLKYDRINNSDSESDSDSANNLVFRFMPRHDSSVLMLVNAVRAIINLLDSHLLEVTIRKHQRSHSILPREKSTTIKQYEHCEHYILVYTIEYKCP